MKVLIAAVLMMTVPPGPAVELDQERITATVGQVITVESVVTGVDERMIAHLNVASLDGVYVDLEDWSADVTKVVPAGDSAVEWEFQAVNAGSFDVYVTLLPAGLSSAGKGPLIASDPVHVTVAQRRTLDTGGAVPVAVTVPALLALLAVVTRAWRRTG